MANYFAAPAPLGSASNNGLSQGAPFRPRDFIEVAQPGDTCLLLDGTYVGADYMLRPGLWAVGKSGSQGNPITMKAQNDGAVIVDAQFALEGTNPRRALHLDQNNFWQFEGFDFCHSLNGNLCVLDTSSNNVFKRLVGYDACAGDNCHVISHVRSSSFNLWEDCAGFGAGRKILTVHSGSKGNIFRRCWFRGDGSIAGQTGPAITIAYNASENKFENCLVTLSGHIIVQNYKEADESNPQFGNQWNNFDYAWAGALSTDRIQGTPPHRHKGYVIGCIVYNRADDLLPSNNSASVIGNHVRFQLHGLSELTVRDIVAVIDPTHPEFNDHHGFQFKRGPFNGVYPDDIFCEDSTTPTYPCPLVDNSVTRITSIRGSQGDWLSPLDTTPPRFADPSDWNISGVSAGTSLAAVQSPWQNTSQSGARLCYQTVDGVTGTTPLWPWPMNERIKAATARAGNYWTELEAVWPKASSANNPCHSSRGDCTGTMGRTREAVDVMADLQGLLGTIPAQCLGEGGGEPPPPTDPGPVPTNITADEAGTVSSAQTASHTVHAGRLILLSVGAQLPNGGGTSINQPSITGHGATWTLIGSHTFFDPARAVFLFATTVAGDSTGAITVDFNGQTQREIEWDVTEFEDVDLSGGVQGAIVQYQAAGNINLTSLNIQLAPASGTRNRPFGFCIASVNSSVTSAAKVGWTPLAEGSLTGTGQYHHTSLFRDSTDDMAPGVTTTAATLIQGQAVEIRGTEGQPSGGGDFPQVLDTAVSETAATLTGNITLPASQAGELLLAIVALDEGITSASWPAGWTELFFATTSFIKMSVAYRFTDGSEGMSVSPTYGGSADDAHAVVYRVSGMHPSAPPEAGTAVTGSGSSTVSFPSLSPSWGAKKTLWIEAVAAAISTGAFTPSSGYANIVEEEGISAAAAVYTARRQAEVATEAPGDGDIGTTTTRHSNLIAIRPTDGGGGGPVTVTPNPVTFAQRTVAPTVSVNGTVTIAPNSLSLSYALATPTVLTLNRVVASTMLMRYAITAPSVLLGGVPQVPVASRARRDLGAIIRVARRIRRGF